MGMISDDPDMARLHAQAARNAKRILAEVCAAELHCQPPTTHGLVRQALERVQKAFADDIAPVKL